MTRHFAFLLSTLLICTVACSTETVYMRGTPTMAVEPQNSPGAIRGIIGQATPEIASAPVSQLSQRSTVTPTQPDYAATERKAEQQKISVTQTHEYNGVLIAQAEAVKASVQGTDDEANRRRGANSERIQSTQEAARQTEWADHATATSAAPRLELDAANAKAQAGNAGFRAWAQPVMQYGVGFGSIGIVVFLALYMMAQWRKPQVDQAEEQEPDPFPELQKLDRPIIQVTETQWDTDTNPPGDIDKFRAFVEYALSGRPLGQVSVIQAKIYSSHPEYKKVLDWLRKKKYTTENNGRIGLSDKGKKDLQLWSYDFNLSPA